MWSNTLTPILMMVKDKLLLDLNLFITGAIFPSHIYQDPFGHLYRWKWWKAKNRLT